MAEKILFVDDEPKVLSAMARQFDGVIDFATAEGPAAALELLQHAGPFAVVLSDMRMPGMSGTELLSRVKTLSPDTVRVMLTGYADLNVTIEAVNEGNIFRFLSKPCPAEVLEKAIADALTQYRLIVAERELLEGTLHGSVKVLSEVLSLVNPLAFGRTSRVQRIALAMARELAMDQLWELQIASLLFPLGCVTVSEHTLQAAMYGDGIPPQEEATLAQHPIVAGSMLEKIPRLELVARIVTYQEKRFDGSGLPADSVSGSDIPAEARILKIASDYEIALKRTDDAREAFDCLARRDGWYDPRMLQALEDSLHAGLFRSSRATLTLQQLKTGMVLAADIRNANNGKLMITSGQQITDPIRQRLLMLLDNGVIENRAVVEELGTLEAGEAIPLLSHV